MQENITFAAISYDVIFIFDFRLHFFSIRNSVYRICFELMCKHCLSIVRLTIKKESNFMALFTRAFKIAAYLKYSGTNWSRILSFCDSYIFFIIVSEPISPENFYFLVDFIRGGIKLKISYCLGYYFSVYFRVFFCSLEWYEFIENFYRFVSADGNFQSNAKTKYFNILL